MYGSFYLFYLFFSSYLSSYHISYLSFEVNFHYLFSLKLTPCTAFIHSSVDGSKGDNDLYKILAKVSTDITALFY